jgi:hypothetical protein
MPSESVTEQFRYQTKRAMIPQGNGGQVERRNPGNWVDRAAKGTGIGAGN